ncbi:MAG: diacylglycerol kinase [Albidovulum sp.]
MWQRLAAEFGRLGRNAGVSWQGFRAAWQSEKSVRQWVWANAASAILAFSIDLSGGERAILLALGLLVLVTELLNTAIEAVVDLASPERHPLAGRAKDCGSAAVVVAALAAGVAWMAILIG